MKLLITTIFLSVTCSFAVAERLSFTGVNDPRSKQFLGQLVSGHWFNTEDEVQATAAAMSSLLVYMTPSIKQMPGYKGLFAGNCSVFFNNATIEQVGCNIIPVAAVSVNENIHVNSPTRLPQEYATQITQSNILLASLFADWTRRFAQKAEQFEISLFEKVQTCTLSQSPTETKPLTPSETLIETPTQSISETYSERVSPSISKTLTPTPTPTIPLSDSLTRSLSRTSSSSQTTSSSNQVASKTISSTDEFSLTSSATESLSTTASQTNKSSLSDSATASASVSLCPEIPTMWSPRAYEDATNQPNRYQVIGSGIDAVILDTFTGLMWEQTVSNATYFWNESAPAGSAQAYCVTLSKGGCKTGWHLPTPQELVSIVDYSTFTTVLNIINGYYWTSFLFEPGFNMPWNVRFTNGYGIVTNDGYVNSTLYYVRCVRGVGLSRSTRYTDETGNNIVSNTTQVLDQVTGLLWQRLQAPSTYIWDATAVAGSAQAYCHNLTLDAKTWRLPTVKEFITLSDYLVSSPWINLTAFPDTSSGYFWSSTNGISSSQPWVTRGGLTYVLKSTQQNCRCIQGCLLLVPQIWSPLAYEDVTNQTSRYRILGTGINATVLDTFTNLMWEQTVSNSTYFWNTSAPPGSAQAYCAGLVKNGCYDWRLPTVIEQLSLFDHTMGSGLAVNARVFSGVSAGAYWTFVKYANNITMAWAVSDYGYDGPLSSTLPQHTWCVRGQATLLGEYTDENGNTITAATIQVTDQKTGLTWQRLQHNL